jgi:hypothetical protein
MYKGLVAKGAHTSTGGRVLSGSSTQYDDEGRSLAVDLDYATCGTCGVGPFRIYGSVSDWTDEGRNMVKDLDPVNCPCGKNRVFAEYRIFDRYGQFQICKRYRSKPDR